MNVIAERVARGAALLDKHRPDWRERIDLTTLDAGSARHCPVGQAFGVDQVSHYDSAAVEWQAALVRLGSPPRGRAVWLDAPMHAWAVHRGFDAEYTSFTLGFDWASLNAAWRELLTH